MKFRLLIENKWPGEVRDLAIRAEVDTHILEDAMSHTNYLSDPTCERIAKAIGVPVEEVRSAIREDHMLSSAIDDFLRAQPEQQASLTVLLQSWANLDEVALRRVMRTLMPEPERHPLGRVNEM